MCDPSINTLGTKKERNTDQERKREKQLGEVEGAALLILTDQPLPSSGVQIGQKMCT